MMEKAHFPEQGENITDLISEFEKYTRLEYIGETENERYRFRNNESGVFINFSREEIEKKIARERRQEKLAA